MNHNHKPFNLEQKKSAKNSQIPRLLVTDTTKLHDHLPMSNHDFIFGPTAFFLKRWGEECRKGWKSLQVSVVAVTSKHEICKFGKHFHGNSKLHQSQRSLVHYRTVGSVVLFHDIANKYMFFLKQGWYHNDLWLLHDHIPSFHNLKTSGKSNLDG